MKKIFLLILIFCTAFAQESATVESAYYITISKEHLPPGRIVSFKINVDNGIIYKISKIPAGWFFSITNDASGHSDLTANIQVGSAAVSAEYFTNFIEIIETDSQSAPMAVNAEIVITNDFLSERHVFLKTDDIITERLK